MDLIKKIEAHQESGGSAQLLKLGVRDPHRIGIEFLQKVFIHNKTCTLRHWHGDFWGYDGARYVRVSPDDFRALLWGFSRRYFERVARGGEIESVNARLISDVEQAIASLVKVSDDRDMPTWIGRNETRSGPYLAFQNGLLPLAALDSGVRVRLVPHTPLWFSTVCLDYEFDPDATCPRWLAFLFQVLEGDADRIAFLQEWMGYSLVFDNSQQVFLVLIGEGANGKGVIEAVWIRMLGPSNVSSISLDRFGDRFALHGTLGKLINFCNEPGKLSPLAENMLKAVVGQDRLSFEKKYNDPFDAAPTVRVVILTNNTLAFADRSMGIARRAQYLPFNISIPIDQQDKALAEKLKGELPGILNWALAGYARLKANGKFSVPTACEAAADKFRQQDNPARAFLRTHCVADPAAQLASDELFARYRDWSRDNEFQVLNATEFGKEVHRAFPGVSHRKRGARNDRKYMYVGIAYGDGGDSGEGDVAE
jgi:putative DNA primase/helicase